MCGIFGCVGRCAVEKVINGLKLLQYRGYDSCGVAYFDNEFKIEKAIGSLENLKPNNKLSNIAFGHTRWATNGEVSLKNAHPHISFDKKIVVVHNGIITNAEELKKELINNGVNFYSTTDTEVIANYIAFNLNNYKIRDVLNHLFNDLKGSFSLIVGNEEGELYLLKKFSPLNVLIANEEIYISSDSYSLPNGELYELQDGDILQVKNQIITSLTNKELSYTSHINAQEALTLRTHKHYMEKEIFETPESVLNTYQTIKDIDIIDKINSYENFTLIGCGTAYHSCLIGEYFLKNEVNKQVETILASNFSISSQINKNHLHIIVSQSGETADCIKAANQIKQFKGTLLVITNERLSRLAKMADLCIFTNAKKEVAVASTKTYCCQVFVFAYISKKLLNPNFGIDINKFVRSLKDYIEGINVDEISNQLLNHDKMILIAKEIDYLTMLEASLKIREIDYVYTLPMYSGELKHGTLSLIDESSITLALNTSLDSTKLSNAINEIKSRKGEVIDISPLVPKDIDKFFKPIYAIIPFQLLSYKIAVLKGRNPDMPRNLAKSVTVE